jgi:radical SAM protein with 4Fe4S-binding SPASM domain
MSYKLSGVSWEITSKCNLHCIHCISSAGQEKPNELSTQEGLKLIEELSDLGCQFIALSGGEPFLRKDWGVLARKARDLKMDIAILSNGTVISDDDIDVLYYLEPSSAMFSLDGVRATHDTIRGQPGAFDRTINVVNKCAKRGVKTSVSTTLNQRNKSELNDLLSLLSGRGIQAWQIGIALPGGRLPPEDVLSERDYYALAEQIVALRKKRNTNPKIVEGDCFGCYSRLSPYLDMQKWPGCQCGISMLSIESDGGVKGCPNVKQMEGNIRQTSIKDIWNDRNAFAYNRRFDSSMLRGDCTLCKYGNICRGGCPVNCRTASGGPYCLHKIETVGYD